MEEGWKILEGREVESCEGRDKGISKLKKDVRKADKDEERKRGRWESYGRKNVCDSNIQEVQRKGMNDTSENEKKKKTKKENYSDGGKAMSIERK